jgi:hypothetical protein
MDTPLHQLEFYGFDSLDCEPTAFIAGIAFRQQGFVAMIA